MDHVVDSLLRMDHMSLLTIVPVVFSLLSRYIGHFTTH